MGGGGGNSLCFLGGEIACVFFLGGGENSLCFCRGGEGGGGLGEVLAWFDRGMR